MRNQDSKNYGNKAAVARISQALLFLALFFPLQARAQLVIPPEAPLVEPLVNPPPALLLTDVQLPDLTGIVTNLEAARTLGKALFWDMQVGGDQQACASCHFHAGADNRAKNQLNPGVLGVSNPDRTDAADSTYGDLGGNGKSGSGKTTGANYSITQFDFPFHRVQDMENRNSPVLYDTNDVVSSQGAFGGFLLTENPDPFVRFPDFCGGEDPAFMVNGVPVRKVEPRNTPTTINAVFNHRNFWDGRANNVFNGIDPFGPNSTDARVVAWNSIDGLTLEQMALENASLASQAVGPPLSSFEMACSGRDFKDLGRGILPLRALAGQAIHANDSLLGTAGRDLLSGKGLSSNYMALIQAAFDSKYWGGGTTRFTVVNTGAGPEIVLDSVAGYTQIEHNFSMFFGIAIMLYEATLVSNQTPYDSFITANPGLVNNGPGTIVAQQVTPVPGFGQKELLGLDVFMNKGLCHECHFGPEFTSASIRVRGNFPRVPAPGGEVEVAEPIENMRGLDDRQTLYDGGFYNIGARPTHEDLGVGGLDPFDNTLSFARQALIDNGIPGVLRVAVDGAFKTPSLRNVELTGPYMHNGGHATLKQVVEFYDRGGDRRDLPADPDCFGITDTTGFGTTVQESKCTNLPPVIALDSLNLLDAEIDGLVAFMLALTDNRVKNEMAPFDHPELIIANGHMGNQLSVVPVTVTPEGDPTGLKLIRAKDTFLILPAVGAGGRAAEQRSPLDTFLRLNPFSLEPRLSVMPHLTPLLFQN